MLIQASIAETVLQAKFHTSYLLNTLIARQSKGDNLAKCRKDFILLTLWIEILEDYLSQNFDDNGAIEPDIECLTADQINELVAKVKILIGNKKYAIPSWITQNIWIDQDFFRDSLTWRDKTYWTSL